MKIILDRDVPMTLLFWMVKGSVYIRKCTFNFFKAFKNIIYIYTKLNNKKFWTGIFLLLFNKFIIFESHLNSTYGVYCLCLSVFWYKMILMNNWSFTVRFDCTLFWIYSWFKGEIYTAIEFEIKKITNLLRWNNTHMYIKITLIF